MNGNRCMAVCAAKPVVGVYIVDMPENRTEWGLRWNELR